MLWKLSGCDLTKLNNAISDALSEACKKISVHESKIVKKLASNLTKKINSISLSGGRSIKAVNKSLHCRVFVKFKSYRPVEIGDLLLLWTGKCRGTVIEQRALLYQAKKFSKLPMFPGNKEQLELYENWPLFEYTKPNTLKGKKRHVIGRKIHKAAKYLLIAKNNKVSFSKHHCYNGRNCIGHNCKRYNLPIAYPSAPKLTPHSCFSRELLKFVQGKAGKTFSDKPRKTGWSNVIKDLTNISPIPLSKNSTKKVLSLMSQSDYSGSLYKSQTTSNAEGNNSPPRVMEDISSEENGLTIIEFLVETEDTPEDNDRSF